MKINELKPGMKQVELQGKIADIGETRDVMTKFGEPGRVATATLQDDSGTIKLSLWNEMIDTVNVNDEVKIENGYVTSFREESQLNVGRYGKLTVVK
ncbi:MAG: OB-fold nucleic acid binding domain-containing protein [Candidatus Bathyarchaeota archaeon]|jgi:replication factor A1|nr:OB-fold nucleic acid binding domain-containing protein [Candidatus Bathyarchaeota archaeon]MCX6659423.1 OB-fold nucleic acid binding domain-containing protein [Candidatus Bathyarchaeota archaeon]